MSYARGTAGRDITDDVSEELQEFNFSVMGRNLFDPSDAQLAGRKEVFSSVNFFKRQSVSTCNMVWTSVSGYSCLELDIFRMASCKSPSSCCLHITTVSSSLSSQGPFSLHCRMFRF